jgi:hypothetical protein
MEENHQLHIKDDNDPKVSVDNKPSSEAKESNKNT